MSVGASHCYSIIGSVSYESVVTVRGQSETSIPADLLLLRGTCIVNEAMLSGESTPLLKESIELREKGERLDIDGTTKGSVLFSGTKVLQAGGGGGCLLFGRCIAFTFGIRGCS